MRGAHRAPAGDGRRALVAAAGALRHGAVLRLLAGHLLGASQQRAAEQSELRFKTFEAGNEQKLEAIRETIERRLTRLQADNNEKLDQMRVVVDEKLQQTLESKMSQSFRLVSERLEQVYKGLGEMQSLAAGVGDLKRVLSGVKTRGILGEIQLGAILEEILSPEQYDKNVATRPRSAERVEYAVRLPGDDGRAGLSADRLQNSPATPTQTCSTPTTAARPSACTRPSPR